jgi:hypothetical protein
MKRKLISFLLFATLAPLGLATVAKADTVPAHCDLYAPGEDYAYLSSNCTFSQRQGHIGIQLQANGVRYELDPVGDRPGNFLDQYGSAVYRQAGLGDAGLIFEFVDGSHLYVYWAEGTAYGNAPAQASGQRVGTLYAHDRGSQINVRSEPTIYSYAVSYGLAGDRVEILQCVVDEDTSGSNLNWCEVQFIESGVIGWVRSDFIIFPSDGE